MKKKIIVFVTTNLSKWMYRSLYEEQFALKKKLEDYGYKVFLFGPGFKNCKNLNFKNYEKKYIKNKIDLFVLFGGEKFYFNGLSNQELKFFKLKLKDQNFIYQFQEYRDCKKIIHVNDFWHNNKYDWKILFNLYGITDVFSMYAPFNVSKKLFKEYFIDKKIHFHKYNRAINLKYLSSIKKNLVRKRFYDAIMIGAVNKFYPFRLFTDKTLSNLKGIKYRKYEHPGYKFFNKGVKNLPIGKNYYSIMENAKIVITCGTKFRLPIPKIWEIMSTGAVLIIDNVSIKKNLNLKNYNNYISANNNNLLSKIKDIISNEKLRQKISKNGMISSRREYSLEKQSNYLLQVVNTIISRKDQKKIKFKYSEIYFLKIMSFLLNSKIFIKKILTKIFMINI